MIRVFVDGREMPLNRKGELTSLEAELQAMRAEDMAILEAVELNFLRTDRACVAYQRLKNAR